MALLDKLSIYYRSFMGFIWYLSFLFLVIYLGERVLHFTEFILFTLNIKPKNYTFNTFHKSYCIPFRNFYSKMVHRVIF
jgi:hypothetical protein